MAEKRTYHIPKLVKLMVAMLLVAGILILSVSAIGNKDNEKTVNEIQVSVQNDDGQAFITKEKVLELLSKAAGKNVKNQSVSSLDLSLIEQQLEKYDWIRKADMYIDNRNTLRVSIEQEKPVARVFSNDGKSFYLAECGGVLPLSNQVVVRIPIVTNFSGNLKKLKSADSLFLYDVGEMAKYIKANGFWMSQIEQIDITGAHKLELIPKLGNHVIRFGSPDNYEEKFTNLLAFYKQVTMKTGWNRYVAIDLRFKGQIVAERRNAAQIKSDSLATIRIMKDIIAKARKNADDSTFIQLPEKHNTGRIRTKSPSADTDDDVMDETIPVKESTSAQPEEPVNQPTVKPETTDQESKKPVVHENSVNQNKKEQPKITEKNDRKEEVKPEKKTAKPAVTEKQENRVPKAVMPTKKNNK